MSGSTSDFTLRTHNCGELRPEQAGQRVTLNGWVDTERDHGHFVFVDLRDRYGVTQVYFGEKPQALLQSAKELRAEFVISVTGKVRERAPEHVNPDRPTGHVNQD